MNKIVENITNKQSPNDLIQSIKNQPLDSVAFGAVQQAYIQKSGMSKEDFIEKIMCNQPLLWGSLDIFLGRIGLIMLPVIYEEVYQDDNLIPALQGGIALARSWGAQCASLTGLLASATDYGNRITLKDEDSHFLISTGHASTVSAMVLNIEHALHKTKRDIGSESIAYIGLGSIGLTTLQLMLSVLEHPKKIVLCDVFSKLKNLEAIAHNISSNLKFTGVISIADSKNLEVPSTIYEEASVFVGATNVPEILSTNLLKPRTIIVDDSAPHIFNSSSCMERFQKYKDILILQGGKLTLPNPISFNFSPIKRLESFQEEAKAMLKGFMSYELMGCVFGSILPLTSDKLPATKGLINVETAILYYNFFKKNNIKASSLQFLDYNLRSDLTHYYSEEDILEFSFTG